MNRRPKGNSSDGGERGLPDDVAHYRLAMLNLHGIISSSLRLERTIGDLHRKYGEDYVYGRSFVTETALDITDTLDKVIFHLNALTGGSDVDLFYALDNLKDRINKCFDSSDLEEAPAAREGATAKEDAVSVLLRKVMDHAVGTGRSEEGLWSGEQGDEPNARDLLICCYNRIFAILDSWVRSVAVAPNDKTAATARIIGIPTSYLMKDDKPIFETALDNRENHDVPHSNPGVSRLLDGIYEIRNSALYSPHVEQTCAVTDVQGMIIYSNETLALYYLSGKFKNIVVANVCDDVGSNHIGLLIAPAGQTGIPQPSCQVVRKLLEWLDFHTVAAYSLTTASIRNMTRSDMENHLNALGKLLSFVSTTRIAPSDDMSVQRNIDVFLEHIV